MHDILNTSFRIESRQLQVVKAVRPMWTTKSNAMSYLVCRSADSECMRPGRIKKCKVKKNKK